jgi:hypothetical protein
MGNFLECSIAIVGGNRGGRTKKRRAAANNKFKSQIICRSGVQKEQIEASLSSRAERDSRKTLEPEEEREKLLRLLANINLYVLDYVWILHSVYVLLQA